MRHVIFFLLTALLAACGKPTPPPTPPKPLVLVSVGPYQHFAERIGKERLAVRSIVPAGANVHTYEPTPRYRETLGEAKIWFRIGEPFEIPLLPLLKDNLSIVDLRDGIDLIHTAPCCSHSHGDTADRHIWMSPHLAKIQAEQMALALSETFPEFKEEFNNNLQELLSDFALLDEEIRLALPPSKQRTILVSHPAFSYFCRDYSLVQLSVEEEGKEPRPKHLEAILASARVKRPDAAIALPQHNNKGTQRIAQELRMPMKMIDPYSTDYFASMRTLTQWIAAQP